jgi:hypothetical protein
MAPGRLLFFAFLVSLFTGVYGASQISVGVVIFAPFAFMEFKVWALATFLLLGSSLADEPKAAVSPAPSPSPSSSAASATMVEEIESPLPDGNPQEQPPTVLLPEPNFLPPPPAQTPGNETAYALASAEPKHTPEDDSRFKEIKDTAMGSSRANYLLKEAKGALSAEARKNFMRAYYYTVCAQMRRLDPNLRSMIQEYQAEEIQKIAAEGASARAKSKAHGHGALVSKNSTAKRRHHAYHEY